MLEFRRHDWFNALSLAPAYGIQARETNGTWQHVVAGGKPLIFDDSDERDGYMETLRSRARQRAK